MCVCQYKIYKKSKCIRSKILNVIQIFYSLQQIAFDGGLNNGSRSPHPLSLPGVSSQYEKMLRRHCFNFNIIKMNWTSPASFIRAKVIIQVKSHATCAVLVSVTHSYYSTAIHQIISFFFFQEKCQSAKMKANLRWIQNDIWPQKKLVTLNAWE